MAGVEIRSQVHEINVITDTLAYTHQCDGLEKICLHSWIHRRLREGVRRMTSDRKLEHAAGYSLEHRGQYSSTARDVGHLSAFQQERGTLFRMYCPSNRQVLRPCSDGVSSNAGFGREHHECYVQDLGWRHWARPAPQLTRPGPSLQTSPTSHSTCTILWSKTYSPPSHCARIEKLQATNLLLACATLTLRGRMRSAPCGSPWL